MPYCEDFWLGTNSDVMTLLVELLSNQHVFFAGVSKSWRNTWGDLPKNTQAVTADTSVSQLQFSFDGGLRRRSRLCKLIANRCGLEVLQCAHSNGCELPYEACLKAAARGKLEMVQWALDDKSWWRDSLCDAATAGGSLRILQWAKYNGCPWDETTCSKAAGSGHLNILMGTFRKLSLE